MIKKILVQDIVSKRANKDGKDTKSASENEGRIGSARERDFLIERLTRKHAVHTTIVDGKPPHVVSHTKKTSKSKSGFGHKWLWFLLPVILIIAIAFLILQFFGGATVTVTPKELTVATSTSLLASNATTTNIASMPIVAYQIITLSATDSQIVSSTGNVVAKPQKATGQIVVFNNFSASSQTLVKNTRFQTADGLIYRAVSAVSIPGLKAGVPGSVTINVVADSTGSKYNIGLVDFTIPGFNTDSARYAKIFGRSKTAMTGGADAEHLGVTDSVRQTAETQIEARLKDTLQKQIQAEKTADSVIFSTASKISFQHLPDLAGADATHAVVEEQGTISSVVFDKKTIGKALLSDAIAKVGGNAEVHGIENLQFTPNVATTSATWPTKPFAFKLSGPMDVTGVVDTVKLIQDLRGVSRGSVPHIISNYPTISKIDVNIKPIWQNSFPTDAGKIKIELAK